VVQSQEKNLARHGNGRVREARVRKLIMLIDVDFGHDMTIRHRHSRSSAPPKNCVRPRSISPSNLPQPSTMRMLRQLFCVTFHLHDHHMSASIPRAMNGPTARKQKVRKQGRAGGWRRQQLKTHKKHSETMRFPAHGEKHPKNDSNAQKFSSLV
jgi:hypothetical protein